MHLLQLLNLNMQMYTRWLTFSYSAKVGENLGTLFFFKVITKQSAENLKSSHHISNIVNSYITLKRSSQVETNIKKKKALFQVYDGAEHSGFRLTNDNSHITKTEK